MKRHRLWRCLAASVTLLVLALCLGTTAFADETVDTGREASLAVCFGQDGTGFAGVEFRVYRVANVSADAQFSLSGDFAGYPVVVNGLDSSGWRTLAQTLDAYVARDALTPLATAETGADGRAVFAPLPTGLYLVTGDRCRQGETTYTPEPFLVSLPAQDDASGAWVYDAVATCKFDSYNTPGEQGETVDREVLKVWQDDGYEDKRPDAITVQLLRDGEVYDTVTLNQNNGWRYTWTGLDDAYTWRVAEYHTPDGYTVTVHREGVTFVMTNSRVEEIPDTPAPKTSTPAGGNPSGNAAGGSLPQTGMLWWPVPVLACGGLLLFVLGWVRRRHEERDS